MLIKDMLSDIYFIKARITKAYVIAPNSFLNRKTDGPRTEVSSTAKTSWKTYTDANFFYDKIDGKI